MCLILSGAGAGVGSGVGAGAGAGAECKLSCCQLMLESVRSLW